MQRAFVFRLGSTLLMLVGLLAGPTAGSAAADPPAHVLHPLINRITAFMRRNEIEGITLDSRYAINPTEIIRLSIVSQLLAYNELHAVHPRFRADVVDRADFLLEHFDEIRSHTAFDGMLGYALLGAYEITGDVRYLNGAREIVARLHRLSGFTITLNWGLMAGMALAKYHELTGDPASLTKTRTILESLGRYQHPDGSFPHYCPISKDIHYTGWMGMELMHIARSVDDPRIQTALDGIHRFLRGRIGSDGITRYQEPCPGGQPNCWTYYYSFATGCGIDADTRGWNNELGYNAMVLDRFQDARFGDVMGLLYAFEDHGAFADKWDYFPPPHDPAYPWSTGDPSVIRTSVIFWSLASIYREWAQGTPRPRPDHDRLRAFSRPGQIGPVGEPLPGPIPGEDDAWRRYQWSVVDSLVLAGADPEVVCGTQGMPGGPSRGPRSRSTVEITGDVGPASDRLWPVLPQPAQGTATLQFQLARASDISLLIYDAGGRLIRELASGSWASGMHRVLWDGRDQNGRPSPSGLYWASLRTATGNRSSRLVLVR